jgi:hypothetical protein
MSRRHSFCPAPSPVRLCERVAFLALVMLAAPLPFAGCDAPSAAAHMSSSAEFGIFYGGQVQERDEIPMVLDAARQRVGFRLTLSPPPQQALEVRWALGRPGVGRRVPDSKGRRARPRQVQLGLAHFRPGEAVFEQLTPFDPGDPLGLWNIRVQLGDQIVIDRPFVVYDAAERARREQDLAAPDAGL